MLLLSSGHSSRRARCFFEDSFCVPLYTLQPSVRRQCDPRVAQCESTRAAFFRRFDSLEKAGIEETDPLWDEEQCHSGINDSAMHLIINYTTGPRSE